ncbi:polyketide synthase [Apiospora arundinis]
MAPPRDSTEPIAVIGMGCRMPGNIRSPSDLWRIAMSETIANTAKVPSSRFNVDAYLHPRNDRPGSFNVPGGYFIDDDPYAFDPGLFNISPVEASWMDPQQRKLLEVVYETLESSGTTLEGISGTRTGCFVGSFTTDFQHMMGKEPDFRHAYVATGIDTGVLGCRLSHVFNLTGPSLMVNTACSSSLTALDLACKAIAAGQCDGAIVGGTNLILTVDQQMNTASFGVLSATSQSHTFDASADGYGRAEGIGAIYIKPLSAALKNGDSIRAIIRSTATSTNGRSLDAMTHPSMKAQADVIVAAHESAGLSLHETAYIECHGTGTPVGDPIEAEAIHHALGLDSARTSPVLIGSVKPNIGHSESASSMGTIIKAILALETGIIPPTAGITQLNPQIPWADLNVQVVTQPTHFPMPAHPRRIGVSAFGYGGTNAHAILEEAGLHSSSSPEPSVPQNLRTPEDSDEENELDIDRPHLLLFSAHNEETLHNSLQDYSKVARTTGLLDLAYTLAHRRSKLSKRAFVVAHKGQLHSEIQNATSVISTAKSPPVFGLVFTGQGAQWPGMGASLLKAFPSLIRKIQRLDKHLKSLSVPPSWQLETALTSPMDAELYDQAEYAQPLCTAVQIILVDLLTRWGLRPVAHVGHSSGEIAAAYACGLISADEAITVAYYRGKAAALIKDDGAMLAVGLSAADAKQYLSDMSVVENVVVACHNSPSSCTLSGDREAIERVKAQLEGKSIFVRILKTGGKAYHSHHMKEAAHTYENYMQAEQAHANSQELPLTRMFSTSSPGQIEAQVGGVTHEYWVENLRNPVLFDEAMGAMLREVPQINTIIEVGPHSALVGPVTQICRAAGREDITYLPTFQRMKDDMDQLLGLAGNLWMSGANLELNAITSEERVTKHGDVETVSGTLLMDLPQYHWTYTKSYWSEPRLSKDHREIKEARHDILGRRVVGSSPLQPVWRNILRQRDLPWLSQHRVGGEVLLPAAGYLALAIEAVTQVNEQSGNSLIKSYTLCDVTIVSATVVPDDDIGTETMFHLEEMEGSGHTSKEAMEENISHTSFHPPPLMQEWGDWLDMLRGVGIDLGPAFQNTRYIYSDGKSQTSLADVTISKICGLVESESRYILHPAVLDSCLQPSLATLHRGHMEKLQCGTIPTYFKEFTVFPPTEEQLGSGCSLKTWITRDGNRSHISDAQLISANGIPLVQIAGFQQITYPSAISEKVQGPLQQDLYLKTDRKIDVDYLGWASHGNGLVQQSVAELVDLFLHKETDTKTLCLDQSLLKSILALRPALPLTVVTPAENTELSVAEQGLGGTNLDFIDLGYMYDKAPDYKESHDLVVGYSLSNIEPAVLERLRLMTRFKGRVVLSVDASVNHHELQAALLDAGFSGIDTALSSGHVITTATGPKTITNGTGTANSVQRRMLLLYRTEPASVLSELSQRLVDDGWDIRAQPLSALSLLPNEQVILLADVEGPLLYNLDERELEAIKHLTETARHIVWVTCGGLFTGNEPKFGMTEGAVRVIRREKGGKLDLVTVDFDTEGTPNGRVVELVTEIAERQFVHGRNGETEYYLKAGVAHIGRLVSYRELHRQFLPDSGEVLVVPQSDNPSISARRLTQGSIEFYSDDKATTAEPLKAGEVKVHVEAIGLNMMDFPDDMDFFNHQVAGTVTQVGENVDRSICSGSRVLGFAFGKLGTFQRASQSLVQATSLSGASLAKAASLPSAFVTAMYALEELAHIQPGDNVVIVDGIGDVGLAAVEVCRVHGANAIIVTSSQASRDFLTSLGTSLKASIIDGVADDVSTRIYSVTGGQGADVVLSATPQDDATIFYECYQGLAEFGRVVMISGTRGPTKPILPLSLNQNISLFQFRLTEVLQKRQQLVARLLKKCVALYEAGVISLLGETQFHGPGDLEKLSSYAVRSDMRSGGIVLAYDQSASFSIKPSPVPLSFDKDATYLLAGCLGGIGRKVASWMAKRGAKHMAFVSRTGDQKLEARETVEALRSQGVDVLVLRADVTALEDLQDAIAKIDPAFPVRGVVNAAAVLHDSVFSNMTFEQWHSVAEAKVEGCLNLHRCFEAVGDLDFFVMTGSVTNVLGSTGQANYGAANSFLDSLARHRRHLGLPAVSLNLPAILGFGYVEEHSLEQAILSKGMYGIYEKEMLEAFEVAMTPQARLPPNLDHIIVGLQPRPFAKQLRVSGAQMAWEEDPRLNWLESTVKKETERESHDGTVDPNASSASESITRTVQEAPDEEHAIDAVAIFTARRLARVLMLEEGQVEITQRSIASHGLDSMIGTEFRNWIFREFRVDIPFQQLLAGSLTIRELAKLLCGKLRGKKD